MQRDMCILVSWHMHSINSEACETEEIANSAFGKCLYLVCNFHCCCCQEVWNYDECYFINENFVSHQTKLEPG
jgi:hypothetical protein